MSGNDLLLVEVARHWSETRNRLEALPRDSTEDEFEEICEQCDAADELLTVTPATGLAGALVKLRLVLDAGRGFGDGDLLVNDLPLLLDVHDAMTKALGEKAPTQLRPLASPKTDSA